MFTSSKTQQAQTDFKNFESYLGLSVKIDGHLKSDGDVFVNGEVKGGITTKKNITVGDGAKINGNVAGLKVIVSGAIYGNVKAQESLELTHSAKIVGDVETKVLNVAAGAQISGLIKMDIADVKSLKSLPAEENYLMEKKQKAVKI